MKGYIRKTRTTHKVNFAAVLRGNIENIVQTKVLVNDLMNIDSIYTRYIPESTPLEDQGSAGWWFIFHGQRLLVRMEGEICSIPFLEEGEMPKDRLVSRYYLGLLEGMPCYTGMIAEASPLFTEGTYLDLRTLLPRLDTDLFMLAGRASQIVHWDETHRYCGRCGHKTVDREEERAKACKECGLLTYPKLCPAIIVAIIKDGKILLVHAKRFLGDMHSVLAGFVEPGETFEECVEREVMEEVGIRVKGIRYFGSQPWPFPNSLMVAFTAEYEHGVLKVDDIEIGHADWYAADALPEIPGQGTVARKLIDWFVANHPAGER